MGTTGTVYVSAGATGGDGTAEAPFGSLQDAIDAAGPGDVILIGDGVYEENIVFRDSGTDEAPIRLVSANGPGAVVIQPNDPSADTIRVSGADHIILDGLTVIGPSDETRQAVHIHGSDGGTDPASHITVSNSVIVRGAGDGIKGSKAENITLVGNTISGGGPNESAIDFVGVSGAVIGGNSIHGIPGIAVMLKGGSQGIVVSENAFSDIGKNALEVGGYSPTKHYPPGFLDAGNQFEAKDVVVSGNVFDDIANTSIRIIGAQSVEIAGNVVTNASKIVTIDDSSKFHDPWFADDITFGVNDFGEGDWLVDRSAGAEIGRASKTFELDPMVYRVVASLPAEEEMLAMGGTAAPFGAQPELVVRTTSDSFVFSEAAPSQSGLPYELESATSMGSAFTNRHPNVEELISPGDGWDFVI